MNPVDLPGQVVSGAGNKVQVSSNVAEQAAGAEAAEGGLCA
jgi:hypothetical protein